MIVTSIAAMSLFRAHSPRYAYQPLSGEGASKFGGRFNRPGLHALYLATDLPTAAAEFQQDAVLVPPCTMVQYTVSVEKVVDFRKGFAPGIWHPLWDSAMENWRTSSFLDRIDPPSWDIADLVLAEKASGILFPSLRRPAGTNLVLYTHHLGPNDHIDVFDPNRDLPHDQASWR